jgi:hypothetical protein
VPCAIASKHPSRKFPRAASFGALWESLGRGHSLSLGLQKYKSHPMMVHLRFIAVSSLFVLTRTMFPRHSSLPSFWPSSVAANPSVVRKVPMLLPFARHLNTLARRMLSKWIKPTPKKKKFLSAKKVSRAPTKAVVSVRLMSASSTKLAPALVPHPQSVSDAASNMIYASETGI